MRPASILGLVLVSLFIITAIIVGNLFVANFFHIKVSELPPAYKFLTHVVGAVILGYIVKKFFMH